MRALSLYQPWATLIACGVKRVETRSWSTAYRGLVAIHAGKLWTREQRVFTGRLRRRFPEVMPESLLEPPLGVVVCVAELVDCLATKDLVDTVTETERTCGDYERGRYGWVLRNVRPLKTPVALRGWPRLWTPSRSEAKKILTGLTG